MVNLNCSPKIMLSYFLDMKFKHLCEIWRQFSLLTDQGIAFLIKSSLKHWNNLFVNWRFNYVVFPSPIYCILYKLTWFSEYFTLFMNTKHKPASSLFWCTHKHVWLGTNLHSSSCAPYFLLHIICLWNKEHKVSLIESHWGL